MNIRTSVAAAATALLLPACVASAHEPLQTLPPVQVVQHVFDCNNPRTLPTQAQVQEWTGLRNFGQVYAARTSLMGDVAHACRKPGVATVNLVMREQRAETAGPGRRVASREPSR